MSTPTRTRVDALLDAGLAHASPEDQAWLAAARRADPELDAEVRALEEVHSQVAAWGQQRAEGATSQASLEDTLSAIFDGIDAGLYDDELVLDGPPRFDDEDARVVGALGGLGAEGAPQARAAADPRSREGEARPVAPVVRLLRDSRLAQGLVAAAAVTVVVGVGWSSMRGAPAADESAVAAAAPAGAVASTTAPAEAPAEVQQPAAAALEAEPLAEEATAEWGQEGQGRDEQVVARERGVVADPLNDLLMAGERAPRASEARPQAVVLAPSAPAAVPTRSATSAAAPSRGSGGAASSVAATGASGPTPATAASGARAPVAEDPLDDYSAMRSVALDATEPASPAPSDDVPPAPRHRGSASVLAALRACLGPNTVADIEIAASSGAVRVVDAPGATATERRCLERVARESAYSPPPGVARRVRVSRAPASAVSDTTTQ